ncbi:MAG: beta-ketoacyl synthase N-terminal-like domain-containing protein [Desulforegulaceae bacterium]|nr:beta-ketoacyl synthase N-terminal-like domain-containing protein [Desulforegulaceae bacterium]
MIKKIFNSSLPVLAYNPFGSPEIKYFKALFESGCLPVFDTEFIENEITLDLIDQLENSEILYGIRIFAENSELFKLIETKKLRNLEAVIVSYLDKAELKNFSFPSSQTVKLIETTDIQISEELKSTGAEALVLKGAEAGGKISEYTSFVLMQWYLENTDYPVIIHGGAGLYTTAGLFSGGASGIVLDSQLYLTDEAPVSKNFKNLLENLEEFDSDIIEDGSGKRFRFFSKLATKIVKDLKISDQIEGSSTVLYEKIKKSVTFLSETIENPVQSLFYLGQDGTFARKFVKKSRKLKDVVNYLFEKTSELLNSIEDNNPIRENSKFCKISNCRYPIIQGPMANISDNIEFASEVYENGGLPFFALGSLPVEKAEEIIVQGNQEVPVFGAGLIGIESLNRNVSSHMEMIKKQKVKFALFAAGSPFQINELEANGIKTWLHTPSLGMLDNAVSSGCKGFIFEGTEAGGHIGKLTSLVLWELGVGFLMEKDGLDISNIMVTFAGGIGTKTASLIISGISSVLAEKGATIAIQLGTPYLFSKEIVRTKALKQQYQEIISEHYKTVLMGNTVGLPARAVKTPFLEKIIENEYSRIEEKLSLKERKKGFEVDNMGSLLVAAKGVKLVFDHEENKVCFEQYCDEECYEKGNYCVGSSVAFHSKAKDIKSIHGIYMGCEKDLFENLDRLEVLFSEKRMLNDEIAVIGMGCVYPDADNIEEFWENIVSRKYSIREIPDSRVDKSLYFAEDRKAPDKAYTKIAGTAENFKFYPEKFGFDKKTGNSISRSQQMLLEACSQAIENSQIKMETSENLKSAAVIIGSCLGNELSYDLNLKYYFPELEYHLDQIDEFKNLSKEEKEKILVNLKTSLSKGHSFETPDSMTLNIEASRLAAWLGSQGPNYVVDAACATSFAAIDCGIKELLSNSTDLVIAGGVSSNLAPESFIGFCKMGALSAEGSFPFDKRAGGFVLGEGAGVIILKRMKDAIRDKDRVLAVLKSVGASSDGKGKAVAAPNEKGQILAIERCFEKNKSFTPEDIDFIEAHGTSTIIGDEAEIKTISSVYGKSGKTGISSVKSQIGHLLGGAGAAGLIKAVLAINNKVLPPLADFRGLSDKCSLDGTDLYIISEPEEWIPKDGRPRRAGVSSYGFGGINYHGVLEEYSESYKSLDRNFFTGSAINPDSKRIVISGLGIIAPGADNQEQFFEKLLSGKKDFKNIPETIFHNDYYSKADKEFSLPLVKAGIVEDYKFDSIKYKIPPNTLKSIDRSQLFALDAASQAVEEACGDKKDLLFAPGNKTGVILGAISGSKHVENIIRSRTVLIEKIIGETKDIDGKVREKIKTELGAALRDRFHENCEDSTPGLLSNIISGRVANYFGCCGANFIVDAACASSAIAMDIAMKSILSGDNDAVLTGGVDTNFYPGIMMVFKRLGLLSSEDTKVFDKRSKGVNLSEAGVVMVMTTYEKAMEKGLPVLAEISSMKIASKPSNNFYSPSQELIKKTADKCYADSSVFKKNISYMDVFGFSSLMMDQIEKQGVESIFEHDLFFGNTKPELGYFKGANPAVVFARLILQAKNRMILPNRNYDKENSIIKKDSYLKPSVDSVVLDENLQFHTAANIFGFGANHGHAIISSLPSRLLKSVKRTEKRKEAITINQPEILKKSVKKSQKAEEPIRINQPEVLENTAVLLCGQGSQYPGMMKSLYEKEKIIKDQMDFGEEIFKKERGYSLIDIMFGRKPGLNSTENTQPAVFMASSAIFEYMKSKRFYPEYFIGHSIGEYSALYASGALGFEDSMKLLLKRSRLMKEADEKYPGKIVIVFKNSEETSEIIEESGIQGIYISNINSLKQTGVSGFSEKIEAFCSFLSKKGVFYKKLDLTGAFHTPVLLEAAEKLEEYLKNVKFNKSSLPKIISNLTGEPYPEDEKEAKYLLVNQIISPIQFVKSIKTAMKLGVRSFIETGTGKILSGLLKHMELDLYNSYLSVESEVKENESLENINLSIQELKKNKISFPGEKTDEKFEYDKDFKTFISKNKAELDKVLFDLYEKAKHDKKLKKIESFNFYTDPIAIAGVAIGLPGKSGKVFNDDNFSKLISGQNFIDQLSDEEKLSFTDKKISRITKSPTGSVEIKKIKDISDVIHLAGKLGYFDLKDYGVDYDYDISISVAFAAGIEALKDAKIPLVKIKNKKSTRLSLVEKFELPLEMQASTGVIMTSLFQGMEKFAREMKSYYYDKFYLKPYEEMENIYYHLMENLKSKESKDMVTDWFFKLRKKRKNSSEYEFDKNLLFNITPLGSAHFAQHIKAKGPNLNLNGACASTTQACSVAEDWIRNGRCDRVIIIGGESATSPELNQWVGSGFLSLGAASVKNVVKEAAKPFDEERHGTILGSGAVSLIVEKSSTIEKRGLKGQAEILGTRLGNSAYHTTGIDVDHLADEMSLFMDMVRKRHGLDINEIAQKTIFMSHETYTPAKGGSADAEIKALRLCFKDSASKIKITNTKGYTGHTLGAGIEDAVLVKCLQAGKVPPIANLEKIPFEFSDLRLKDENEGNFEYGLHFSAGFGSHFAFLFIKKIDEAAIKSNPVYEKWLESISGLKNPQPEIINSTLCIESLKIEEKEQLKEEKKDTKLKSGNFSLERKIKKTISDQTGYSKDMLNSDFDLEADLGIDTVKQVEIFGKISSELGIEVPEDLKLRELNTISKLSSYLKTNSEIKLKAEEASFESEEETKDFSSDYEDKIKQIISVQTGYSKDMLNSDFDLEADLGIDTVKQVEIFGKISSELGIEVPEDLKLRELNTISKLSSYLKTNSEIKLKAEEASFESEEEIKDFSNDYEDKIKQIISVQTGYSKDMLDSDFDLEADLGIDTVKQVEIFGKISSELGIEVPEDLKLRELNTISKLALYLRGNFETKIKSEIDSVSEVEEKSVSSVKRYSVSVSEFKTEKEESNIFAGKNFLVTTDDFGFSEIFIEKLEKLGIFTLTLGRAKTNDYCVNFANHDELESLMDKISKEKDINGFIHLSVLNGYFSEKDHDDCEEDVKSFFIISKKLSQNMKNTDFLVSSISFSSVVFPYSSNCRGKIYPAFSGISGIAKTIGKEFEQAIVKIVDFNIEKPGQSLKEIGDQYIERLLSKDRFVETGVSDGLLYKLIMKESVPEKGSFFINKNDKVVVSGGARGITFEILKQVAHEIKPEIIILGRSDIYSLEERFKNTALDESMLIAILKKEMENKKPLEIKNMAKKILGLRESLENIEYLKSLGIKVSYHSSDVTDYESVRKVALEYDNIQGIIHAAGLEESQIIEKKELSSFNRVFDTKVKGAKNLLKAFDDKKYQFFIGFSSVTARFGNQGQADYTGANDMLGRILNEQKIKNKEKIYKVIAWTAWKGAGMATNETVLKVLESRGLTFLPLDQGVDFFMDELKDRKTFEAVFTGLDKEFDKDCLISGEKSISPFLDSIEEESDDKIVFSRVLDLKRDLFLMDHQLEGIPVFLGATGIEAMAEAAYYSVKNSRKRLSSITDFEIPYGIKILKKRPKKIEIEAVSSGGESDLIECRISSRFESKVVRGDKKLHYKGLFHFAESDYHEEIIELPEFSPVKSSEKTEELLYHPKRLFMEGSFKTIKEIVSFKDNTLITRVSHNEPREFFKGQSFPKFYTDPVLIDSMFQTGGVFEFLSSNNLVLPSAVERFRFIAPVEREKEYLCITTKVSSDKETISFNLILTDESGKLYMEVKNFKMVKLAKVEKDYMVVSKIKISA